MASAAAAAASGAGIGSYGQGKFIQDANGRFFLLSPAGKVVPAENAMQTLASPTFGAYMRSAVPSPFPFKGLIAVEVKVSIWNGRKLTIFHGENASKATVSGMRQFNSSASPLEVHWEVSVMFSDDDIAARELFGGKSKSCEASFTLHRADVKDGGTLDWDGAVVAFAWSSEPTPPALPADEEPMLSLSDAEEAAKAAGFAGEAELLAAREAAKKEYAEAKAKGQDHLSTFLESTVKSILVDGTGSESVNLMAMAMQGGRGAGGKKEEKDGEAETEEQRRERLSRLLRKLLTLPIPACMNDGVRGFLLRAGVREVSEAYIRAIPLRAGDIKVSTGAADVTRFVNSWVAQFCASTARSLEAEARFEEAVPFYRHCCKMTRGGGLGRGNEGNDLGNLALALKRAGKLEESLKVYDDALAVLRSEGPKETAGLPRLQRPQQDAADRNGARTSEAIAAVEKNRAALLDEMEQWNATAEAEEAPGKGRRFDVRAAREK